jgi:hypothetical protein
MLTLQGHGRDGPADRQTECWSEIGGTHEMPAKLSALENVRADPARWPQQWTSGIQTTFRSTSSFNDLTMPDRRSNAAVVENAASVAE